MKSTCQLGWFLLEGLEEGLSCPVSSQGPFLAWFKVLSSFKVSCAEGSPPTASYAEESPPTASYAEGSLPTTRCAEGSPPTLLYGIQCTLDPLG